MYMDLLGKDSKLITEDEMNQAMNIIVNQLEELGLVVTDYMYDEKEMTISYNATKHME